MRTALAARENERATFYGTFTRFGTKHGWQGRQETTLLFTDLRDETGTRVCDHLWLTLTRGFARLTLQTGDTVQFDARVKTYLKGYRGRRDDVWHPITVDYTLSRPSKVTLVPFPPRSS